MHLARDPRSLGGGAEPTLLVALEFEPRGLLLQRGEQRSALADRDAEHAGRGRQPGEADPDLQRLGRRPAHRRHDGAQLDRAGGERALDQAPVQGHPVQGDQHRGVGQLRGGEQPLRERDERDHAKAQNRAQATQQQRGAQSAAQKTTASVSSRCWVARPTMLNAAVARQIARSIANG